MEKSKEVKSKKTYTKDEKIAITVLTLLICSLVMVYGIYAYNRYQEQHQVKTQDPIALQNKDSETVPSSTDEQGSTKTNTNLANIQSENLFTYSDNQTNFVDLPWVVDQKEAEMNLNLLTDGNTEYVNFNFFDGKTYLVQKESFDQSSPDDYNWTGKIIEPTGFTEKVSIITINGILIASIPSKAGYNDYSYEVLPVDKEQTGFLVLKVSESE